jgi:hypothetical protein
MIRVRAPKQKRLSRSVSVTFAAFLKFARKRMHVGAKGRRLCGICGDFFKIRIVQGHAEARDLIKVAEDGRDFSLRHGILLFCKKD